MIRRFLPEAKAGDDAVRAMAHAAFPRRLGAQAEKVADQISRTSFWRSESAFQVVLGGEPIEIPERLYTDIRFRRDWPAETRLMALCLMTRHHDGFRCEAALREMLQTIARPWMLPFIYRLLGEYVVEILEAIEASIDRFPVDDLAAFQLENPEFWRITRARVTSYYHCYHLDAYRKDNYPGYRILARLGP